MRRSALIQWGNRGFGRGVAQQLPNGTYVARRRGAAEDFAPCQLIVSVPDNYDLSWPLDNSVLYTGDIDWGDGTVDAWVDAATLTHTYATAGEYTIRMTGTVNDSGWRIGSTDKELVEIVNVSDEFFADVAEMFRFLNPLGAGNIRRVGRIAVNGPNHQDALQRVGQDLATPCVIVAQDWSGADFMPSLLQRANVQMAGAVIQPTSGDVNMGHALREANFNGTLFPWFELCFDFPQMTRLYRVLNDATGVSQSDIDRVLELLADGGAEEGDLGVAIAGGIEPSSAGWVDYLTLINRDWEIEVNGTPPFAPCELIVSVPNNYDLSWPLANSVLYTGDIDWGDGNVDSWTDAATLTHTYATAGEYTIKMTGTIANDGWEIGSSDKELVEIVNVSANFFTSAARMFKFVNSSGSGNIRRIGRVTVNGFNHNNAFRGAGGDLGSPCVLDVQDWTYANTMFGIFLGGNVQLPSTVIKPTTGDVSVQAAFSGANVNGTLFPWFEICFEHSEMVRMGLFLQNATGVSQSDIDRVLELLADGGAINGSLGIDVAGGIEPSAAGWVDYATLISRGWTIDVNGTPP